MESFSTNGIPCLDELNKGSIPSEMAEISSIPIRIISYIERQFINNIWPYQTGELYDPSEVYCRPVGIQQEVLMEFIRRHEKISKNLSEFSGAKSVERKIKMLGESYSFRRPEDVYALLHEDASLVDITHEAYIKIRKYFASDDLFMEAFSDPNAPNSKELLISIATDLSPDEAIKNLDAFDEDWWLNASMNYDSNLCIKVEYK
jgi:hypothetical protein